MTEYSISLQGKLKFADNAIDEYLKGKILCLFVQPIINFSDLLFFLFAFDNETVCFLDLFNIQKHRFAFDKIGDEAFSWFALKR